MVEFGLLVIDKSHKFKTNLRVHQTITCSGNQSKMQIRELIKKTAGL